MSQIKASIIVNNYNYDAFLKEAIDSALAQTYDNVEVVVVDDGSTDGSREIIASFGDSIVTVLKKNEGQASAFNRGFEVATGDVILFLDSDDRLDKDCLERAMAHWQAGDSLLLFQLRVIDGAGESEGMHHPADDVMPEGSAKDQVLRHGNYPAPPTSGLILSREALAKLLPVKVLQTECSIDSLLRIQAPFLGGSRFVHEVLGDYRIHHSNFSANCSRVTKIRRILFGNQIKQEQLEALGEREGFSVPTDLFEGGLKDVKGRLASLRLDKEGHPFAGDTRLGLCKSGVLLSAAKGQGGLVKRVSTASWFMAVACLPRSWARRAIELAYRETTLKLQSVVLFASIASV